MKYKERLSAWVENRVQDLSTKDAFSFGIRCDVCDRMMTTTPVPFIKAGVEPENDEQKILFGVMYERGKWIAKDEAIDILAAQINWCPVCGDIVCDCCFVMAGDIDLCTQCAERLNVSGNVVCQR